MPITIIGLGPGDPGLITRAAWDALAGAGEVALRTSRHPCVPDLPQGPVYRNFDALYESAGDFEAVYAQIVSDLLASARRGEVMYAVPGDPLVGEASVTRLLAAAREEGLSVRMVHGVSFVEPVLAALAEQGFVVDALDGLQIADALDIAAAHHPALNPDKAALIAQVYGRQVASDVKLTLMNQYPDAHPVWLVHSAGTSGVTVEEMPLHRLDHSVALEHLTTLVVPPLTFEGTFSFEGRTVASFEGFQETIAYLRAPEGCPWDREQTHQSLRHHLLEETYEVLAAIDANDPDLLREELGDLLLQIVLHSQIAVDEGEFHMGEVIAAIDAKLKRRHPHVWGDVQADNPEQVRHNWQELKAKERADKGENDKSMLDGVPQVLPALAVAHAYDSRVARLGFDWQSVEGVLEKLDEEIAEVKAAGTPEELASEIGDVLFVVASWARWLKVEPESALRGANGRFYARYTHMERLAREQDRPLNEMSFDELDALWQAAKKATNASD